MALMAAKGTEENLINTSRHVFGLKVMKDVSIFCVTSGARRPGVTVRCRAV